MPSRVVKVAAQVLGAVCVLASAMYVIAFVWVAAHRAAYPFDLEWMEGGLVDHLARLLSGKPLYVAPSIDFVPYIYNPLYYVLSAGAALVFGVDYLAPRLVSITATLVSFGLMFAIVWRETRAFVPALFAPGVYAGSFALSGTWFDLARVDATALAFSLGAWYAARWAKGRWGILTSATLVVLSFATKQPGLSLLPALALTIFWVSGPRQLLWLVPPLALALVWVVWLNAVSDGWYAFYAYRIPAGHPNEQSMYVAFWKDEIFSRFSVPVLLALHYFAHGGGTQDRDGIRTHAPFALSLLGTSYLVRLHSGSFLNDDMPAHAALAIVAGLSLGLLIENADADRRHAGRVFAYAAACCQFLFLTYDPKEHVPTAADLAEGRAFIDAVRSIPGDVLITHHGRYATIAGKPMTAQGMAVFDIVRAPDDPRGAKAALFRSFEDALSRHRFAAVFTDDGLVMQHLVQRYYREIRATFVKNPHAFRAKAGVHYRPLQVHLPR